jgi:2-polyprenyl-6-methoxyphenol hydroxylase-like FAD-dependent oxidoreductase
VHTPDGNEVGSWGLRKWGRSSSKESKRQNIHIARQSLRRELLDALGEESHVQWGCQLEGYTEHDDHVELTFQRGSDKFSAMADLLVGADGIRRTVGNILIGEQSRENFAKKLVHCLFGDTFLFLHDFTLIQSLLGAKLSS